MGPIIRQISAMKLAVKDRSGRLDLLKGFYYELACRIQGSDRV